MTKTTKTATHLILKGVLAVVLIATSIVIVIGGDGSGRSSSSSSSSSDYGYHVADQFKAPSNEQTTTTDLDASIIQRWKDEDEQLWRYVNEHVPAVLDHTGSSAFDEHLKGVQAVLRYWGAPTYLTNAGLFHSIYGTEGFQGFSLPLSERPAIQSLIGEQSERLCFIFCMVDRYTFDMTVMDWTPDDVGNTTAVYTIKSRPELGRFDMTLSKEEWLDFVELTLADWLEQVEGAASKPSELFLWKKGEAYAYRRMAYRKMVDILSEEKHERLSTIPRAMHEAVMATESMETRYLIQERNPPVSDAARRAVEALRAAGVDIPIDLSPQPGLGLDSGSQGKRSESSDEF
jgi:hypothetical protein